MNEVSCRCCTWILEWLEANAISPELWLVGLPVRFEQLRDPDNWIDWDLCISLSERLERLGDRDRCLRRLGRELSEQVLTLEGMPESLRGVTPEEIYLHHAPKLLDSLFRDVTYQIEDRSRAGVTLRLGLPERIERPRPFFELCIGFLERVPQLLGRRAAQVEADLSSPRARFVISQLGESNPLETAPRTPAPETRLSLEDIGCDLAAAETPAAAAELFFSLLQERLRCPAASLWLQRGGDGEAELLRSFGSPVEPSSRSLPIGRKDSPIGHLEIWDPKPACAEFPLSLAQLFPWLAMVLENLHARAGAASPAASPTDIDTGEVPSPTAVELQTLFENTRDVVCELGRDGRLGWVSPQILELLGRPAEQFKGKSLIELILPEDRDEVVEVLGKLLISGEAKRIAFRASHHDGSVLCLEASIRPFQTRGDELRLACVVRDITAQKQTEDALRKTQDRYRSMVDNSASCLAVTNREGRVLFTGSPVERTLELPRSDDLKGEFLKRAHPDDIEPLCQAWRVTQKAGQGGSADVRISKGNSHRWYELSWNPFRDSRGEDLLAVVMNDITERKQAETALGAIAEGLAGTSECFERSLVQHLAIALQMDFAVLATLDERDPGFAHIVAMWGDGQMRDSFRYQLADTPCENLAAGEACSYPTGLQRLFPRMAELISRELDSYVGMPICESSGRVIGFLCAMDRRPLTRPDWARSMLRIFTQRAASELERGRAVDALRVSEERYRAMTDNARDVIVELSEDGSLDYVSRSVEELLGFPVEELMAPGKAASRVAAPDIKRIRSTLQPLLESEDTAQLLFRAQHADGSRRWLDTTSRSFRNSEGRLRVVMVCRDITERIRAEREREQLVSIAQNSSDLIALASRDGSVLFLNEAGQHLLGFESEDQARSKSLFDFLVDQHRQAMRFQIMPAVYREHRWSGEVQLRHFKTGNSIPTLATFFLVPGPRGNQPQAIATICRDISEYKRTQMALRESEVRYRMLAENPYDLVSEVDGYGHFVYVSPNFHTIFDYSPEELLGRDAFPLMHPDDRDRVERVFRRAIVEEGTTYGSFRFRHRNGSYRWVDTTARGYRSAAGQIMAVLVSRDVTERKQAEETLRQTEEHLRQAQKMEAIGRLAGGIAHDFNNLLTAITGYCDLLLEELGNQHPVRRDAEEILKASERAAALTQQLLAFSRRQILQPKVLDLNTLVADIDRMLRRLIGEDIELVSLLDGELYPVKADPGQLQQVILNLVVNARDAMPRGGKISLETANTVVHSGDEADETGIPAGAYVTLTVRDTGVGMDSETLSRIWEPFFTTKDNDKGTGLGLSTVHGIINQSGGHIRAQSQAGRGSSFTIYLPQMEPVAMLSERHVTISELRGSETILVVEDAEAVRKLVTRYLQRHGYKVLDVTSGIEALRHCTRYSGEIHLLITDVVLPKMNGPEIAQRAVEIRPEMRVMYISGFSDELLSQHGVIPQEIVLLEKPFTPAALLRTVRETLDREDLPGLTPFGPAADTRDADVADGGAAVSDDDSVSQKHSENEGNAAI